MANEINELHTLARSAQDSGTSEGRMVGEFVLELLADTTDASAPAMIVACMEEVEQWAEMMRKAAEQLRVKKRKVAKK